MFDHHELREGSPGSEARLNLMWADLLISCATDRTLSTGADKGDSHPVTLFPLADVGSGLFDYPGKLVPGNMGKVDVRVMPHPAMPVTPTDSGGLNPDDNSSGSRAGVGEGLNSEGAVKFPEEGSGHGANERRGMSPDIPAFTSRRESSFGITQSEQRL